MALQETAVASAFFSFFSAWEQAKSRAFPVVFPVSREKQPGLGAVSRAASAVLGFARSISFQRRAKKIALAPDQSAHASRSEIVKRQCEFQRDNFETLRLNPGTGIRDIVNSAGVHAGALTEKQQRAFGDLRLSDGSSVTRFRHARTG